MSIISILQDKGFDTLPESFYSQIDLWKSWYDGDVKDFHKYYQWNGQKRVQCYRYSAGMGKKVAEDWANLLLNEKVKITLEGNKEQEFFDTVCKENNFLVKGNEMQELKAALGTAAYVARVTGVPVDRNGAVRGDGKIKLDYVTAPNIFPLSWENGIVEECAFSSAYTKKGKKYAYIQIHRRDVNGKYVIENSIYEDNGGALSEANLAEVPGFENVPPLVNTGSDKPLFVIDRLNIANNVDNTYPMGIPAFANAIDQLKGVDEVYSDYVKEFEAGKLKVMYQPPATKTIDGEPTIDENDTYFYALPEDIKDGAIIQPISVPLRAQEFNTGFRDMLNVLSSKCGFGENHYRFENGAITTATQVISENSSMFRTVKKHEIVLEDVLIDLCRIILRLGNSVMGMGLNEDVEISIDFDDSIIEDKAQEENRIYMMLNAGLMDRPEARSLLMNEDIETARAALPGMEEMADEPQNEVE